MKKTFRTIAGVLSVILTVVFFLILISVMYQKITGDVPGVFGFHLMYVRTGSMAPEIDANDAILVRETDAETLKEGNIVCYRETKGEMAGKLITHKVIRAPYTENGERFLQTKGTANAEADDPIRTEQVFGKVLLRLKLLGKAYRFFCTVPGIITVIVPIALMMIFEIRQMTVCIKNDADRDGEKEII